MDTSSTKATQGNTTTELEKFQLFYEFVPVQKQPSGRIKRSHSSSK